MPGCGRGGKMLLAFLLLWSVATALPAEERFFEGSLRLPRLQGFQRLVQSANAPSHTPWTSERQGSGSPVAYMLANPSRKLWVTIRRAAGSPYASQAAPVKFSDLQAGWKAALASRGLTLSDPQPIKWAPGEACLYKVKEALAVGHHGFLICLRPHRKTGPQIAFLLTVVYADSAAGEARKLAEQLGKKAAVD